MNNFNKRYLPSSSDIKNRYNYLQKINTKNINENVQNRISNILNKAPIRKVQQNNINLKDWKLVVTTQGIFYNNKNTNQWMNSFGVVKNSLEEFNIFLLSGDQTNVQNSGQSPVKLFTIDGWGNNDWGTLDLPATIFTSEQIATSRHGTAVILEGGILKVWGSEKNANVLPSPLPNNAIAIEGGFNYYITIQSDNTVYGWIYEGIVNDGQVDLAAPNITKIDAGYNTSIALDSSGTVYCFGNNDSGQADVPVGLGSCISIAAGYNHCAAIETDGTIVCWGDNSEGQCTVPAGLTGSQISAGEYFTCVLKGDGTVQCWGINSLNQCNIPENLNSVIEIDCGAAHTVALKSNGTAVAWGYNDEGQCNLPNNSLPISKIKAGTVHTAIQYANGTVEIVSTVGGFQPRETITGPTDIKCSYRSVATIAQGKANCWGQANNNFPNINVQKIFVGKEDAIYLIDFNNQLYPQYDYSISGDPGIIERPSPLPNAIYADGGYQHSIVLKPDGTVVCWGWNFYNQCDVPAGLTDVVQVTATSYASFALKSDGTIVSWGGNNFGERNIPGGLNNVTKIVGGWYHVIALKSDGTVVCWGDNQEGQCDIPAGLANVTDITAGWVNSGVIKSDGTIALWGSNDDGQLDIPPDTVQVVKLDCRGKTVFVLKR